MVEKIRWLYQEINRIAVEYMCLGRTNNLYEIKKIIPQIQDFISWFLNENIFGIENTLYEDLRRNLVEILQDMCIAMQNEDRVLMHDAVNYGLVLYLEMFLPDEERENSE